jgi:hypothetical protein
MGNYSENEEKEESKFSVYSKKLESITWRIDESNPEKAICTLPSGFTVGILEVKLEGFANGSDLTTYITYTWLRNKYVLDGPTRIVYSADGMSASYDSRKYVLRDLQGNEIPATFRTVIADATKASFPEGE